MNRWTAIIPIKPWALAKSRLRLPAPERSLLARAFASDVLDAVGASDLIGTIVIVSARNDLARQAFRHRAVVLHDRPLLSRDGLNKAVEIGRHWASSWHPDCPIVVVPSDLPCLTPAALDDALNLMHGAGSAFTPDASGTGTTLLSASTPDLLRPAYGPASRDRHAEARAAPVHDVDRRVRHDVDTLHDLFEATHLGLGEQTRAAIERIRLREVSAGAGAVSTG